jgi:hypothetical protein
METGECLGGIGSSHWNTDVGRGSRVGITDDPVWGFYCSDDADVIAHQLEAMRQARIDTILISWFGWGYEDVAETRESPEGKGMHRAVKSLLSYISSSQAPFKVAIFVEPFMPGAGQLSKEQRQVVIDRVWDDFYSEYPDILLQWEGRPLLGSFSPLDLSETRDSRFTFRMWGSSNEPEWKTYEPFQWNGYPDVVTLQDQISDDGVIIVFPRFDEYWPWIMGWKTSGQVRRVDPFLRENVYEQAWQVCADNRHKLNMIVVYSWNEHGDHSAIEPTRAGNPTAAEWRLVDKTSEHYQLFLTGQSIEIPPGPSPSTTRAPSPAETPPGPSAEVEEAPRLGALWYPVYGYDRGTGECLGGLGTSGWNEAPGGPSVAVTPNAGFYCFGDARYQEWAVARMKEAGIWWVMLSWNGWGDIEIDGTVEARDFEAANRDSIKLLKHLETVGSDFKAVLLVEPFTSARDIDPSTLTKEQKQRILDYIWEEFYSPYSDVILRWEDRPLLVQWYPMALGPDDRFTIRTFGSSPVANDPNLDWNWLPDVSRVAEYISSDGFTAVCPRFDEYWQWILGVPGFKDKDQSQLRRMDPFLTEDVYGKWWEVLSENRSEVKLILVYSWNAYAEQAFIEPAENGPLGLGYRLLEETLAGIEKLRP